MKFLSVCSGIEAASVAWEPLGWTPVLYSEIEKFPRSVLKARQRAVDASETGAAKRGVPLWGDFTAIRTRHFDRLGIQSPDLLAGGTPCQAFSVAGARRSLKDARGNLTLSYVRLANAIDNDRKRRGKEPLVIVWENVPGVLSTSDNAFGCFLGALAGSDAPLLPPKGGKWSNAGMVDGPQRRVAWRILDAQYFGVPQRRRRVFVVASAREFFDPGAVLFEPDSLRGNSPESRKTSKDIAGTIEASIDRRRGSGMNPSQLTAHPIAPPLTSAPYADRGDGDLEKLICMAHGQSNAEISEDRSPALTCNHEAPIISHTLRGEGFDASEDGSGRGTPLVPVCFSENSRAELRLEGKDGQRTGAPSTGGGKAGQGVPCIFHPQQDPIPSSNVTHAMGTGGGTGHANIAVSIGRAVRRLMPIECERLQGFPDNYTRIPVRRYKVLVMTKNRPRDMWEPGKCGGWLLVAPDGPRYKALGNSMAVPCMAWIGARIQMIIDYFA